MKFVRIPLILHQPLPWMTVTSINPVNSVQLQHVISGVTFKCSCRCHNLLQVQCWCWSRNIQIKNPAHPSIPLSPDEVVWCHIKFWFCCTDQTFVSFVWCACLIAYLLLCLFVCFLVSLFVWVLVYVLTSFDFFLPTPLPWLQRKST